MLTRSGFFDSPKFAIFDPETARFAATASNPGEGPAHRGHHTKRVVPVAATVAATVAASSLVPAVRPVRRIAPFGPSVCTPSARSKHTLGNNGPGSPGVSLARIRSFPPPV
eukprot:gene625-2483_t